MDKNIQNILLAEDIIEALNDLYTEGEGELKRLPNELYKFAGSISVALSEATKLKSNLQNEYDKNKK